MKREVKFKILGSLLIIAAASMTLFPTISNEYMFDDLARVQNSEFVHSSGNIPLFFTKNISGGRIEGGQLYRPLLLLSVYLDSAVFGRSALASHLVNLLLHVIASLLLFYVFSNFFGYNFSSLIPSLIFAVHPVHIDTIAFIINRSDIMVLVFLLSALLVLLKNQSWRSYLTFDAVSSESIKKSWVIESSIAAILFLMALLSKETAVTALLILIIFVFMKWSISKKTPISRSIITGIILFMSVFIVYFIIRYLAVGRIGARVEWTLFKGHEISRIIPTMSRVFAEYVFLLVAPFSLRVNYSEYTVSVSPFEIKALLAYFIHSTLILTSVLRLKKNPGLSFLIFGFYVTLLPVSYIVPFYDIKAERFLYLPSIFFCLALSYPLKYISSENKSFRAIILLFIAIILCYGTLAFKYATLFSSPRLLWSEMIRRSPKNALFHSNMGLYLFSHDKDYAKALPYIEKGISLNPRLKENYSSIGIIYDSMGEEEKAEKAFLAGLKLVPDDADLNLNYAVFNCLHGNFERAYPYLKKVLEVDPKNEKALIYIKDVEKRTKLKTQK